VTRTLADHLDLADPDTFRDGVPHERIADLRRRQPVSWQPMAGEPGFYAVLTHAGVQEVAQDPQRFSSTLGGVMLEDATPESLEMTRGTILGMDPPRHGPYRKSLSPSFKRAVVAQLEQQVRDVCRDIMTEARDIGPEVELVHDLSAKLPSRVIGRMMGIPQTDWPLITDLSERMLSGQDREVTEADTNAMIEMVGYAMSFAASRRTSAARGAADVTTVLLDSEIEGHPMTDLEFASIFAQLVAAGNDTTKTLTASGVVALVEHPDQLALLRDDPTLLGGAVEEMLRWANPVHYMRRTAVHDTTLQGVALPAGAKVAMYYTAANRDEQEFVAPDRFDIRRAPNHHLSFGIAEHFCLGAHLARLESRVFFAELLRSFPTIELAGAPVRLRSNLVNGYRAVPVRLTR
jgi:cytochrome P450